MTGRFCERNKIGLRNTLLAVGALSSLLSFSYFALRKRPREIAISNYGITRHIQIPVSTGLSEVLIKVRVGEGKEESFSLSVRGKSFEEHPWLRFLPSTAVRVFPKKSRLRTRYWFDLNEGKNSQYGILRQVTFETTEHKNGVLDLYVVVNPEVTENRSVNISVSAKYLDGREKYESRVSKTNYGRMGGIIFDKNVNRAIVRSSDGLLNEMTEIFESPEVTVLLLNIPDANRSLKTVRWDRWQYDVSVTDMETADGEGYHILREAVMLSTIKTWSKTDEEKNSGFNLLEIVE